jgi:LPS-assembly protein
VAHPVSSRHLRLRRHAAGLALIVAVVIGTLITGDRVALSQVGNPNEFQFATRPKQNVPPRPAGDAPMLVEANEIKYDYSNNIVAAMGNVQIYYKGSTIEADQVIYDQKAKRLRAEGNARLTQPDGNITYGQIIDLTDDYRDGFVDSLRVEMPDDTRMAAPRADRGTGNYTVLNNGVYTACEPCKDDPKKPPLWQVRAARIIHDQGEKMLYFEDATIDFFGLPLGYYPFLSTADPTVKRKSGFLFPMFSSMATYGVGITIPYELALAPNYDLTLYPTYTSQQGLLMEADWEHRLSDGSYTIKAAGIYQQDPGYFVDRDGVGAPTTQAFRGVAISAGQFDLADKWAWGWTGVLITDPTFIADYNLGRFNGYNLDPFRTGAVESLVGNNLPSTEGVSQLYLVGRGDRSYFDLRSIYYTGFSLVDQQGQIPVILPVLDYNGVFGQPVVGGELSYKVNLTSLTRQDASFDAISKLADSSGICANPTTADAAQLTKSNCLLRGMPGDYTRASAEIDWRRTFTTDNGMQITPFAQIRGDVASLDVLNQPGVSNYLTPGQSELARAMPAVGVEYRYPFIDVEPWGTQTIEPIAQLILRPNETEIGKFPNEDSQSLVFDDTNLFSISKFSGWDRVEGGGRANAGFEYTAQVNKAGTFNVLFGQSYQIFGLNSYTVADTTNTGLDSGLDKPISDYVYRIAYQPNSTYMIDVKGRLDEATLASERFETEVRSNFGRWGAYVLYGLYAPQPALGFLTQREGFTTGATFKLTDNWVITGAVSYDLYAHEFSYSQITLGYVDDCFMLSLNASTGYIYNGAAPIPESSFGLAFSMRTLGPNTLATGY